MICNTLRNQLLIHARITLVSFLHHVLVLRRLLLISSLVAIVEDKRVIVDLNLVRVSLSTVHRELAGVLLARLFDEGGEMGKVEVSFSLVVKERVPKFEHGSSLAGNGALDVENVLVDVDAENSHAALHAHSLAHVAVHFLLLEDAARVLPSSCRAQDTRSQRVAVGGRLSRETVALDCA
jgi:hypothetical protein